ALFLHPSGAVATGLVQEAPTAVADLSRLPRGSAMQVNYGGQPLLLIRPEEEGSQEGSVDVRAYSAICTHEGCVVGWNAERQTIRCPCHGGVFDVSGNVVEGPPPAPLYPFAVEVKDGKIFVTGVASDGDRFISDRLHNPERGAPG
ncbi:MAG: Rieske (2Fe-2S) protein, partial [Gemmatimonadetes bacterium]|nr:Rieske (2Fe-2S) protein [Gemmatimonadota bacterium]